jgi:hypothetical protein
MDLRPRQWFETVNSRTRQRAAQPSLERMTADEAHGHQPDPAMNGRLEPGADLLIADVRNISGTATRLRSRIALNCAL